MKSILMAAALSMMAGTAMAQSAKLSPEEFAQTAASSGQYEILSSQMIEDQANAGAEVKTFADQMIKDHTKAAGDLKMAAESAGLSVSDSLLPKDEAMLDELKAADDPTRLYLQQQIKAHREAVELHQSYAANGTEAHLASYAKSTTPVLKKHLDHVEMLQRDASMTTSSTGKSQSGMKAGSMSSGAATTN